MALGGDLNMPNPGDVFGPLGLVDAFPDPPPATTPDGRSIDRVFTGPSLRVDSVGVLELPGADHFLVTCGIDHV
ncbi:hypothetical protein ABZS29_33545 [Kribbella sp. NPDC005582]|uniref:hypothetical protein n=1 Tax=Kribbella sp. NPDC005582 TaxID=3156893 RepID=UPI0033A2CE2B